MCASKRFPSSLTADIAQSYEQTPEFPQRQRSTSSKTPADMIPSKSATYMRERHIDMKVLDYMGPCKWTLHLSHLRSPYIPPCRQYTASLSFAHGVYISEAFAIAFAQGVLLLTRSWVEGPAHVSNKGQGCLAGGGWGHHLLAPLEPNTSCFHKLCPALLKAAACVPNCMHTIAPPLGKK